MHGAVSVSDVHSPCPKKRREKWRSITNDGEKEEERYEAQQAGRQAVWLAGWLYYKYNAARRHSVRRRSGRL